MPTSWLHSTSAALYSVRIPLASWQVDEDTVECPICGAMTKADRIEDGHVCGHCDACGTERFLVYIPKVRQ